MSFLFLSNLSHGFNHYVFEVDDAFGVMALQSKCPAGDLSAGHSFWRFPAFWLRPVHGGFAIDLDDDVLAFDLDVIVKPLPVFRGRVVHHVLHGVEPTGFPAIAVGGIHLALVALARPAGFLVLRVKIYT